MNRLHCAVKPFARTKKFELLNYIYLFNPLALFFQLVEVHRAQSVSGVSLGMMIAFAIMQCLTCVNAIRLKNFPMLIAFFLSFVITLAIVVVVAGERSRLW
jgi:uncharacterized protein with PQ loop repeat